MPHFNQKPIEFVEDSSGCYNCISHKPKNGGKYFFIKRDGRHMLMHRYIYELSYGVIPEGMSVRHKCDNGLCINPNHLEIGTHDENMKDMVERNRSLKGSKNYFSKLTDDDVRMIRASNKSNSELARELGVSNQLVSNIRLGKAWQHVI